MIYTGYCKPFLPFTNSVDANLSQIPVYLSIGPDFGPPLFLKNHFNLNFLTFNFEASLQEGLDAMGFDKPTPIQEKAIPVILAG